MFMAKYPNTMTDATLNTTVALIIYSLGKLHKECRQCLVLAVRTPQLDINGSHLLLQISQLCRHTEGYLKLSPYLLLTTGPVNKKLALWCFLVYSHNVLCFCSITNKTWAQACLLHKYHFSYFVIILSIFSFFLSHSFT